MTDEEAKEIIRLHAEGKSSNVRQLLEAWEVGCRSVKDGTIEELYEWAKEEE